MSDRGRVHAVYRGRCDQLHRHRLFIIVEGRRCHIQGRSEVHLGRWLPNLVDADHVDRNRGFDLGWGPRVPTTTTSPISTRAVSEVNGNGCLVTHFYGLKIITDAGDLQYIIRRYLSVMVPSPPVKPPLFDDLILPKHSRPGCLFWHRLPGR